MVRAETEWSPSHSMYRRCENPPLSTTALQRYVYSVVASRREICNIHIVRHRFIKDLAYYTNFLLLAYQHRLSNCGQNQWHFERVEALLIHPKGNFQNVECIEVDDKRCMNFEYLLFAVGGILAQLLNKDYYL